MLYQLEDRIRDAYQHAEDSAERAKKAKNPSERDDWLMLERRYLLLARSLEFSRRLERFTDEARRRK
jgi:hypothetical protein